MNRGGATELNTLTIRLFNYFNLNKNRKTDFKGKK